MRTLLIGVGAPLRGDDSVGLHVVRRIQAGGLPPGWSAVEVWGDWLAAIDGLAGVERVVVVDACELGLPPGTVVDLPVPAPVPGAAGAAAPVLGHGIGLRELLDLVSRLGLASIAETRVIGIQVAGLEGFAESCSPAVAAAIDEACARVLRDAERG